MQEPSTHKPALWLVKRDFRLADNAALIDAAQHESLLVVLILEPSVLSANDASVFHLSAQLKAASALKTDLRSRGSDLFFAISEAPSLCNHLFAEIGFSAIYSHQETGNALSYDRDKSLARWCMDNDVLWIEKTQNGVVRGPHKRMDRAKILAERLLQSPPLAAPAKLPPCPPTARLEANGTLLSSCLNINSLPPVLHNISRPERFDEDSLQALGEQAAQLDLHQFLNDRGLHYTSGISSPNRAFTQGSRLSAHLAWGTLTLRQIFHARAARIHELGNARDHTSAQWRKSLNAFQSRLYWHDHFVQRFESASFMEFDALNPAYRHLKYPDDGEARQRWLDAATGIPLVDACLRCVQTCGFLNFRMRAMLVSVACYGLGIHWRDIQYPLARWFYDYEPGIHFSQVQMQAGVIGINTIRVYNPHKQLLEQDGDCHFVKQWIPELRDFTAEEICAYQTRPLGRYPAPPAGFETTARMMKDQIFAVRKSDIGKKASAEILEKYGSRRTPQRQRLRSDYRRATGRRNQSAATARSENSNEADFEDNASQQLKLDL